MKCVPSTRNPFHAPRACARCGPAVVLLLSNTCDLMMKFLLVSKLKRPLCSSVELEANESNKLFPGFRATSAVLIISWCLLLWVQTGSVQRNASAGSSQVAVNSRWKGNSWICSVISWVCLPLWLPERTWWQEKASASTSSTACIPDTHTAHIRWQAKKWACAINHYFFSSSGFSSWQQEKTSLPNLPIEMIYYTLTVSVMCYTLFSFQLFSTQVKDGWL